MPDLHPSHIQYFNVWRKHLRPPLSFTQLVPDSLSQPPSDLSMNGPFAANGHLVQNPPCWNATYALGHPKQVNSSRQIWIYFVLYVAVHTLAFQHGGFCTMWLFAAKGQLRTSIDFHICNPSYSHNPCSKLMLVICREEGFIGTRIVL